MFVIPSKCQSGSDRGISPRNLKGNWHQNTVENGITAERNFVTGSHNIKQQLVPLQSGQLNMRIAF